MTTFSYAILDLHRHIINTAYSYSKTKWSKTAKRSVARLDREIALPLLVINGRTFGVTKFFQPQTGSGVKG